jgi:predicted 3-demethylubiquinone-9 3-methyltransferase (glyoxalase superfamily)
MQKITPFLWFDGQAEEAMNYYVSIFKNSKVKQVVRFGDSGPGPKGSVMTVNFELNGQEFVGLNGGPGFPFTNAVSFVVSCESQEEVDHYWDKLSAGGQVIQCGWLKDKFGLPWQIVPTAFWQMIKSADAAQRDRVMRAMFQMTKFDIAALQKAYDGK